MITFPSISSTLVIINDLSSLKAINTFQTMGDMISEF